jgi:DNA primase
VSVSGVAQLPVLSGIETLWVAVDHDDAGQRAACRLVERCRCAGIETFRVMPTRQQSDLNDIIKEVSCA